MEKPGRMNEQEHDDDIDDIPDEDGMKSCLIGDMVVVVNTRGAIAMAKGAYPARYGLYGEIRTREFSFHFNPTGEIRYIRGLTRSWPHPWEWLKRTWGNDWMYYSVGLSSGLGRIQDLSGESYLPRLSYESNAILEGTPYSDPKIAAGFSAWTQIYGTLCSSSLTRVPDEIKPFVRSVIEKNDENALIAQTERLHAIFGSRVTVLPPDTRHVDYEVIPVNIADGCLYRCTFCSVKSGMRFNPLKEDVVTQQIDDLAGFFGTNIQNFNAVFIGNHDALAAGADRVAFAAGKAYQAFSFDHHRAGKPSMFLFASAGSFLKATEKDFEQLNTLPYRSYINIGLESSDGPTLKKLGKPIDVDMVERSLRKMIHVNETFQNIEVTANFLIGTTFSEDHHEAVKRLLSGIPDSPLKKGSIYLSPLIETVHREKVLPMFHDIKKNSGLPVYIYLIQRL